ncbi:putative lipid-transfer protein DIR1 [Diospyros lotus]|uniref:putative lipid-transfer protein DIR1 n=1 Tax=Diospyros lotus TaxID=55363 RepID=UPI002256649D|nr:putative lipid-transfer protein DIR1 [Diospyros lotus]
MTMMMVVIGKLSKMMVVVAVALLALAGGLKSVELCDMNEEGVMACKPSVTEPNPVDPSPECCQALSAANLTCLCDYKNSLLLPSLGIDPQLAMALPAKCNLTPPPNC